MAGGSTRAIIAAFLANAGIAIAKFVGFIATGSSSMLAEAVHSVADAGNQALLLLGGARSRKDPTPSHPFGHARERYFWSFVVALVLFTLGGLFSIFEGVEKIRHPHEIESPMWAFAILGFAIILEGFSFRTAIVEGRRAKGRASWTGFIRHSKEPELPVVLLEDLGALVGLVIAIGAIGLAVVTGNGRWDGIGSVTIGSLLCLVAFVLASEMKSLLIGEGATTEDRARIVRAIEGSDPVVRLIHLRTQHLGPDEMLVGAKIEFTSGLSTRGVATAIDVVETAIRDSVPTAKVIYLEPDMHRDSAATDG